VKAPNLSGKRLAERMHASGSQVGRLLDSADGNVTLKTLLRAATMVGRRLSSEFV
jgi:antitoxin HicB